MLLEIIPKDCMIYKYYRGINRDWNSIIKTRVVVMQSHLFLMTHTTVHFFVIAIVKKYMIPKRSILLQ